MDYNLPDGPVLLGLIEFIDFIFRIPVPLLAWYRTMGDVKGCQLVANFRGSLVAKNANSTVFLKRCKAQIYEAQRGLLKAQSNRSEK